MSGRSVYRGCALILGLPLLCWGNRVPPLVESGDLVFRTGDEAISSVITSMDSSGFSHVGMLYRDHQQYYVIHATPAEHPGARDEVVVDTLEFFKGRAKYHRVAYYHVSAPELAHRAAVNAALAQRGRPFSVLDARGIYCTELVDQAWAAAGYPLTQGRKTLHLPGATVELILPQHLIASPRLKNIAATQ
ncbi:YiiX/YebB-like N1pC/P60 family cysteine hydrolase [Rosenbergiella collisarenosi]|uniref:YiiX/YebB-like N1pC/P60 family cysteine hydrolase n=1 Tax=Rosenbergiella collisarenosi TaxID=1544695 RepID=UPI001F4DC0CD|nr:YiiX/YebB-like N1pC/P60 family cysteine hydrolase [Rosenbergiella collisarenosi]